MLTQENIDELNQTLSICGAQRLTDDEIKFLNAIKTTIDDKCNMYLVTQSVLLVRLRNDKNQGSTLSRLKLLANANSCNLRDKKPERPRAIIPVIGGILGKRRYEEPEELVLPELPPIIIDIAANASPYVTRNVIVEIRTYEQFDSYTQTNRNPY